MYFEMQSKVISLEKQWIFSDNRGGSKIIIRICDLLFCKSLNMNVFLKFDLKKNSTVKKTDK